MINAVLLRRAARTAFFFGCLLAVTACSTPLFRARAPEPTMAELTYRAADMLSQQTQAVVTRDSPLQIGHINDITRPNLSPPLGKAIAGQLAARFVQLGYSVSATSFDEMNGGMPVPVAIPPAYGGAYVSPPLNAPATAILSGHYAVADDAVLVNLRLLDIAANKVLAAYDYSIPLTRDVKELSRPPRD
jgi:hypothetical protein